MIRDILKLLILVALFIPLEMLADGERVGVIYPDVREPYRSIFTSILEGIFEAAGDEVHTISVAKEVDPQEIVDWVKDNGIKDIIALGSRGQKMIENINLDVDKVILGAVVKPPAVEKSKLFYSGIMLTPSPQKVYEAMKQLVPGVDNVYMIYSDTNQWYAEISIQNAGKFGYNLTAIKSESIKDSANEYRKILEEANEYVAIWLLQDTLSSDSRIILPVVLEAAWKKKIPVISNNASHVKRGVLLALYPDHFELGISLAEALSNEESKEQKFFPFEEAHKAANTRTADHLDLDWSRRTIRGFSLVFPNE